MSAITVGILGAGQLGRMLALAGYPLGVRCLFLDPDAQSPGGQVGDVLVGPLDDADGLARLTEQVDVVTFDIENVDVAAIEALQDKVPIYPPPPAIDIAQDRLSEKRMFQSLNIPTAPFVAVATPEDLHEAARALGWPIVLKARRMGYDGRGQRVASSAPALRVAWEDMGSVPAIAEAWIQFERELSLIGVRGAHREQVFYPLAENVHQEGILSWTVAPYEDRALQRSSETWLASIIERLRYRGVLTVEFFHTAGGLLANEMAPRVHNSGHWTIEGAETSQFENHLRAILGWPLGDARARGYAATVNLLGELPAPHSLLTLPGVHFHSYGKTPRPKRKLGHCTIVDSDRNALLGRLQTLRDAALIVENT